MTKQDYGITQRLELYRVWRRDYQTDLGCTEGEASTKAFDAVSGLSGEQCHAILEALRQAVV